MIDYDNTLEIALVLTQKCNIKCWYCYWNEEKDIRETVEHDFDKVIEFIKLHERKNLAFQFYGGEPTIHPKLIEYTDRLKKEFVDVELSLFTNLLKSKEYFSQFNKYINFRINCSFHTDWIPDIDKWFEKVYLLKYSSIYLILQENNFDKIKKAYFENVNKKTVWVCPIYQILGTDVYYKMKETFPKEHIHEHSFGEYKNLMCKPGFIIRENGDIMRCWAQMGQRYKIFNLYTDPIKHIPDWTICGFSTCFCEQEYPRMKPTEYYRKTHGK
jgi:sulfatase maturation enzyme AslB (radical SAM superfamily)